MFYRDTWCEIDLDALRENIALLQNSSQKELFAVVKANGYGMGDSQIISLAETCGVKTFCVASLDEAISLRKQGITSDILVLGTSRLENLFMALKYNIILTIPSVKLAEGVIKYNIKGLRFHIKIDSGMHRLGVQTKEEVLQILHLLSETSKIEGIFSHYANSDEEDQIVSNRQFQYFKSIVENIPFEFKWVHMSNSDASLNYKETFTNAVRCGIALFGISSVKSNLSRVVSLYTRIVHIQHLPKGSPVSYSGKYITKDDEWIATLPIGYADGFLRCNQSGKVYLDNEYGIIAGKICMDQMMISVNKYYPEGTIVELFGAHIPIQEVSSRCNTIPHEVLTSLSNRVVRVYLKNKETVEIVNGLIDNNL